MVFSITIIALVAAWMIGDGCAAYREIDQKIISMYAKGMTTRQIPETLMIEFLEAVAILPFIEATNALAATLIGI